MVREMSETFGAVMVCLFIAAILSAVIAAGIRTANNIETVVHKAPVTNLVTVSKSSLATLLYKARMFDCLIQAGVEDWEGYFDATEIRDGHRGAHER